MFLVVGLGNPDASYTHTRHNAGFLAIDALAHTLGASWKHRKDAVAEIAECHDGETKLILVKPLTYMNASGKAVASLAERFHIEPQHILVFSDDTEIPWGTLRVRSEGGAGGHNGLKSIIASIGTQQFPRVRIGVGAPPPPMPLDRWVLAPFAPSEQTDLPIILSTAVSLGLAYVRGTMTQQTVHALATPPHA